MKLKGELNLLYYNECPPWPTQGGEQGDCNKLPNTELKPMQKLKVLSKAPQMNVFAMFSSMRWLLSLTQLSMLIHFHCCHAHRSNGAISLGTFCECAGRVLEVSDLVRHPSLDTSVKKCFCCCLDVSTRIKQQAYKIKADLPALVLWEYYSRSEKILKLGEKYKKLLIAQDWLFTKNVRALLCREAFNRCSALCFCS